jgi:hypothetical protein
VDQIAYFKRGPALEVRQYGANTEEMAFRRRDLHSGHNQEIIDRQTVRSHIPLIDHILNGIAGVMVGNGKAIEAFGSGRFDQLLWAANTVARKERVAMEVDLDGHEAS